jgi:leucyl/phenylalanyl-tRNA--protein transferase
MPILQFPDPRNTDEDGILALGGDLEPESLQLAYSQGIFPWPISGLPLAWFCPPERAILEYDYLHIAKSLARLKKKGVYRYTIDQDFKKVISLCAQTPRPDQKGTWITRKILQAYQKFHDLGFAHSIEVWREETLVGGLYGVDAGGAFAAESMFHLESNTSKLAILYLLEYLQSRGLNWIDIQVMTPHMEVMGARMVSRDVFLEKLKETQTLGFRLFGK